MGGLPEVKWFLLKEHVSRRLMKISQTWIPAASPQPALVSFQLQLPEHLLSSPTFGPRQGRHWGLSQVVR